MIEAKELSSFRKALNRLMKREYSRDDAVKVVAGLFLEPEDVDPWAMPSTNGRADVLMDKYATGDDADAGALCVRLMASLVDRADEQGGGLPAPVSAALSQLAAMCYGEHAVETQRKWIRRKGYQLSDAGARSLYSRERRRCREQYGEPENLWASKAVEDVVSASAGRIPLPPSDGSWDF